MNRRIPANNLWTIDLREIPTLRCRMERPESVMIVQAALTRLSFRSNWSAIELTNEPPEKTRPQKEFTRLWTRGC